MRLDFNVLWVEDNQGNVHAQRDRIEILIRKQGFKLCVKFASSVEEAKQCLSDHIYGDHVDLILMDYELGAGAKGDEGLAEVREIFPYKDIVFYSAMATARLMEMAVAKDVQGIFASHRNDLPDVVEGVFENLVHKVLDIDHSRGIVMGATSHIDQVIAESLSSIFDSHDDEGRKASIEQVTKRLNEKLDAWQKTVTALQAITHISELDDHHAMYTSDDKLRLLRRILKQLSYNSDKLERLDRYRNEVIPKRNDLAHIRVEVNGFSRTLYDRKGEVLTSEAMRELRVRLLEYHEFFEDLLASDIPRQN